MFFTRFFFLLSLLTGTASQALDFRQLTCEYRRNPLGVEAAAPRLSWQLVSDRRGVRQTAYQILVADRPETLNRNQGNVWDSGKRVGNQSIQVPYAGSTLLPAAVYYWKVRVWDEAGRVSDWSPVAHWQMGLLRPTDWGTARWMALERLDSAQRIVPGLHVTRPWEQQRPPGSGLAARALPQFRRPVVTRKPVRRVTAFVASPGHFELFLNGRKVGDHFLDPGWTDYRKLGLYVTLDLTPGWTTGPNVLGLMLGNGFYHVPDERYHKLVTRYGNPCFLAQIRIDYQDGTTEQIGSDASWKAARSPITFSSIYGGEDYDASREQPGWQSDGFDDRQWRVPVVVPGLPALRAQFAEPLKITDTLRVVSVNHPRPGVWVYDLGQNFSGIPRLRVRGTAGQTLTLRPAELLDDSSLVTQQAVGTPVFFKYTLRGGAAESWQPQFTYYGFRYVQVEGAVPAGEPNPEGLPVVELLEGLHTRNAARQVGTFTCSNALFNDIHDLIDWSVRSNLASVLTDCPHREKLGWLEVAHLMGGSMQYSYDLAAFFTKTVQDMQAAQLPNGLVPDIAPELVEFEGGFRDSPEWGSAAVILPWYLYQWYGDRRLLAESYPMMTRYVGYLESRSRGHLLSHGLGDWFDLGPKPPGESQLTPRGLTASAIYFYDLTILAQVARLLGKPDDAQRFARQAEGVRQAFNTAFFNPLTGQYGTGSQTAQAMVLYLNLAAPTQRPTVMGQLLADIRQRNYALTTGDIGFRYLIRTLEGVGASDVVYAMNRRDDVPGYGYQLARGATALTESWQAHRFVSNNHCMLGHLTEWFYSGLAGIRADSGAVAYQAIRIAPQPVGDVTAAQARFDSPYGPIESQWQQTDSTFSLRVTIPPNTTATVRLPLSRPTAVYESGRPAARAPGVRQKPDLVDGRQWRVGSGSYTFTYRR